jgi:hypothetical protein
MGACSLMCSCLEFLRATCYKRLILFVEFLFHILLHVRTKFPSSELCLVGVSFMYLLPVGFILIACLGSGRSIGVKNSRMLQHNLQNKNGSSCKLLLWKSVVSKIGFVLAFCYLQWIIWSDLFWDKKIEKTWEKCFFSRANWSNLLIFLEFSAKFWVSQNLLL